MSLPEISLTGGITTQPDLKYGPTGQAVAKFRVVCKDRKRDVSTGAWADDNDHPLYLTVTVFGKPGENLAESVWIGDQIVVTGRLTMSEWTDDAGNKRTSYEVTATSAGVATAFGPAKTERVIRDSASESEPATPSGWGTT